MYEVDGSSCADLDNDGVFSDVDPDDSDPCIPDVMAGPCCYFVVLNNQALGKGSFLDIVACAQSGDTITFDASLNDAVINFASQYAVIAKDLTIVADPAANITIVGNSMNQAFWIQSGFNVWIEGLKILVGNGSLGEAFTNDGNLTLNNCDIMDTQGGSIEHLIHNKENLIIKGNVRLIKQE